MERGIGSFIRTGDGLVKKKRSKISRWPRSESTNRDENNGSATTSIKKEYNLNQYVLGSPANSEMNDTAYKRMRNDDRDLADSDGVDEDGRFKDMDEIVRKDAIKVNRNFDSQLQKVEADMDSGKDRNSRSSDYSNGSGNQNNIRKVKLKVGGVTRTIHTNSTSDGASAGGVKPLFSSSAQARQKLTLQDTPDSCRPLKSVNGLQGVPWKDFSEGIFSLRKESSAEKMPRERSSEKKSDKSEPARKSKRAPKRRALDEAFDDEDDDDEIRYLEKIRNLKVNADSGARIEDFEEGSRNQQKRVSKRRPDHQALEDVGVSSMGRDGKKSRSERGSEDADYGEEDEPSSDGLLDSRSKDFVDSSVEVNKETSLTRRQRALQSGKDSSTNLVEFPDGLPPAPSRKHKFSEVEQQARKAEAAQRRRMQVEKQNRESEAEAIRKILGQDSTRKKREDKLKKRRDELAQEKAANALTLPPNTVRCVIGPSGTVVTFSEDIGLPSILTSKPCSYPPPREKCAGPLCTNPYIYRDSKSKLPLCSLKCYKVIHEQSDITSAGSLSSGTPRDLLQASKGSGPAEG